MTDTLPAHSHVGASSAKRWMNCPGSVRLSANVRDVAGEAAAQGTVAHELAELAITGQPFRHRLGESVPCEGHDILVDQDMLDAVTTYKVTIDELCTDADTVRHAEVRFHITALHPALFGTADCVLWHPARQHLDVLDFKYGAGIPVDAIGNPQLQYYAVGAMLELGYNPKTIAIHIVQPRCFHPDGPIRTWDRSSLDMLDFAADMLDAVVATEQPDAPLVPGPWCKDTFCPVRATCPALAGKAQALAKLEFRTGLTYSPEQLAEALAWAPILEAWIKGVREFAYREAEHGNAVPGWKLVEKQGREKWAETTTVEAIAGAFRLDITDITDPPTLKSPAQMRKLVPGKNDKERAAALAPFTTKESSGHALVPDDDKRLGVKESARQVFSA